MFCVYLSLLLERICWGRDTLVDHVQVDGDSMKQEDSVHAAKNASGERLESRAYRAPVLASLTNVALGCIMASAVIWGVSGKLGVTNRILLMLAIEVVSFRLFLWNKSVK